MDFGGKKRRLGLSLVKNTKKACYDKTKADVSEQSSPTPLSNSWTLNNNQKSSNSREEITKNVCSLTTARGVRVGDTMSEDRTKMLKLLPKSTEWKPLPITPFMKTSTDNRNLLKIHCGFTIKDKKNTSQHESSNDAGYKNLPRLTMHRFVHRQKIAPVSFEGDISENMNNFETSSTSLHGNDSSKNRRFDVKSAPSSSKVSNVSRGGCQNRLSEWNITKDNQNRPSLHEDVQENTVFGVDNWPIFMSESELTEVKDQNRPMLNKEMCPQLNKTVNFGFKVDNKCDINHIRGSESQKGKLSSDKLLSNENQNNVDMGLTKIPKTDERRNVKLQGNAKKNMSDVVYIPDDGNSRSKSTRAHNLPSFAREMGKIQSGRSLDTKNYQPDGDVTEIIIDSNSDEEMFEICENVENSRSFKDIQSLSSNGKVGLEPVTPNRAEKSGILFKEKKEKTGFESVVRGLKIGDVQFGSWKSEIASEEKNKQVSEFFMKERRFEDEQIESGKSGFASEQKNKEILSKTTVENFAYTQVEQENSKVNFEKKNKEVVKEYKLVNSQIGKDNSANKNTISKSLLNDFQVVEIRPKTSNVGFQGKNKQTSSETSIKGCELANVQGSGFGFQEENIKQLDSAMKECEFANARIGSEKPGITSEQDNEQSLCESLVLFEEDDCQLWEDDLSKSDLEELMETVENETRYAAKENSHLEFEGGASRNAKPSHNIKSPGSNSKLYNNFASKCGTSDSDSDKTSNMLTGKKSTRDSNRHNSEQLNENGIDDFPEFTFEQTVEKEYVNSRSRVQNMKNSKSGVVKYNSVTTKSVEDDNLLKECPICLQNFEPKCSKREIDQHIAKCIMTDDISFW